jgi:hypothetical protein
MVSHSKQIFIILLIFIVFSNSITFATYISDDTEYVWSTSTVETISQNDEDSDFLDLSCESAILIEQTTRKYFI